MEFRQCTKLVGRDGALGSIVYDTGFGENFLVDFPAVTTRTADGDLPLGWKIRIPMLTRVVARGASCSGRRDVSCTDCKPNRSDPVVIPPLPPNCSDPVVVHTAVTTSVVPRSLGG